jgi:hypothetical protein
MAIVRKLGPSLAWSSEPGWQIANDASARRCGWTHPINSTTINDQAILESDRSDEAFLLSLVQNFRETGPQATASAIFCTC